MNLPDTEKMNILDNIALAEYNNLLFCEELRLNRRRSRHCKAALLKLPSQTLANHVSLRLRVRDSRAGRKTFLPTSLIRDVGSFFMP